MDMDLLTMILKEALLQKATQTSITGANFSRQDLSRLIYLEGMPAADFFLSLPVVECYAKKHEWSVTSVGAANGTSGYAVEGAKGDSIYNNPTRIFNTCFRRLFTVKITATQMALFAKSGGWILSDSGNRRTFQEEMAYQMYIGLKTMLSWLNYVFINGIKETTIDGGAADVQCDGLIQALKYYDLTLTSTQGNIVDASGASLTEAMLIALGKLIVDRKTGMVPQVTYITSAQKTIVNTWGGTIFFTRNDAMPAGKDVDTYNNGRFTTRFKVEYDLPTGTDVAVTAVVDHTDMKRADLIPIGADDMAKVDNSVEKMMSWEGTLEYGTPLSSGIIINLNE